MMDLEKFWSLIEKSKQTKQSIDMNEQGDALMYLLTEESVETMVGFHERLEQLQNDLESKQIREVAISMNYGNTDHVFKGFKNWIIALGREHYQKTKSIPSYLLSLEDPDLFVVGRPYLQDLNYVASGAYYEKMGLDSDWDRELFNYRKKQREQEIRTVKKDPNRNNSQER